MTPTQLLEEAKGRFVVLYHSETTALQGLLKQALKKYQEKAGEIASFTIADEEAAKDYPVPDDYLGLAMAVDDRGSFIDCEVVDGDVSLDIQWTTVWPVKVDYYQKLEDWQMEDGLPNGVSSLVFDYLVALIEIPNTDRERKIMAATNLPIDHLPSKQELQEKLKMIEEQMEENRALCSPALLLH